MRAIVISIVAMFFGLIASWLGGELVYRMSVGVDFDDIVAPRNARLEISRLGAQGARTNDSHFPFNRAKPIAFIDAIVRVLMAVKS